MKELAALQGMDVYLIDQLLKGRIRPGDKILDAGCGSGRNIHYLLKNELDVTGIDANPEAIDALRSQYPSTSEHFIHSSLEAFRSETKFDFIVCNAVLHFAQDHEHFSNMFASLTEVLATDGVLFIRMTSDIGLELEHEGKSGVFDLPDGSVRYLITRKQIDELLETHALTLVEPVKTVKVEELRSMTTLVLTPKQS